jgi:hypothetical protein
MPLNIRSTAVSIAVICFFSFSFVGWISGLSPYTCCKRALAGAAIAYISGTWAVRIINAILLNAIISNQINKQKEQESGGKN